MSDFPTFGSQGNFDLHSEIEVVSNGIPMGVLSDGTPYLTLYGLAKICGIDEAPLRLFTTNWDTEKNKPRGTKVASYLALRGYENVPALFTRTRNKQGVETHAYPDYVCMSILQYYAFDATGFDNTLARNTFIRLADYTLKRMIYEQAGYKPNQSVVDSSWQVFQQRLEANDNIPIGYFSIFREMADLTLKLINSEFKLDPHSIPDISVGRHWGDFWRANNMSVTHGERILFPHHYPEGFPQARGTQKEANIYPSSALGIFRDWLFTTYVNVHLNSYLAKKVAQGALPAPQAERVILALRKPELPKPH